jgi:hypothetical protein
MALGSDRPKRKRGRRKGDHTPAAEIARAEKIKEALNYRRLGYTFEQIGDTMSCAPSTAFNWVMTGIRAISVEEVDAVRTQMLDRLDHLLQGLMKAVILDEANDSATVNSILAIEDRRAKLLGIYELGYGSMDDPTTMAGKMHGAAMAEILASRPLLRPDAPAIPLMPIL